MTMYEISAEMAALMAMAEEAELDPQAIKDTLEGLAFEFEKKAEQYAIVYYALTGDAELIDKEIKRLQGKKKVLENNAERIKKTLETAMIETGNRKFKTARYSFGIQKNAPSLGEVDEKKVPAQFWVEQAPKLDRAALLKAVKADPDSYKGIAELKQTESIRIK